MADALVSPCRPAAATAALAALLAAGLSGSPPSASAAEARWVSFHAAQAEPSALARRALGPGVDAARPAEALRGLLVAPDGAGPFPAVVLVHGCRGVRPAHRGWAHWLASHGVVALLVDSFFTRHAASVCAMGPDDAARPETGGRVFDAFGGLEFLRRDPRVDPERVAIMGWNTWAPLSAVSRGGPRELVTSGFRVAVAISPHCPRDAARPAVPALIVAAGADDRNPAQRCRRVAQRHAGDITLRILEGAPHGFDEPLAGRGAFVDTVFDLATASLEPLRVRHDPRAHEAAARAVLAFLTPRLQVPSTAASDSGSAGPADDALVVPPHPVADPGAPGPDRAPVGHSLFDRVFADGRGAIRVPLPFSRVLRRLENELDSPRGSRDGLAITLIPLGRSLQRAAADPEFFRFPRIVVAVDGEPRRAPAARWLKDRLFLGYQESARVIEIISYNDALARFEFQVVEDYGPGGTPTVRGANRALCTSCHQNGAPIFSRAGWDETSGNMSIADRLHATGRDFHGIPVLTGGASAARLDNATDRANLLSTWQLLWREGCGADAVTAPACRGALLVAMLQYRLSGSSGHDRTAPRYRADFLLPVRREWRRRWPGGLAIPNGDLVNREPLLEPFPTEIAARDDPLTPRPPLAVWHGESHAEEVIAGLAGSLSSVDLGALDRHLASTAGATAHAEHALPCRLARRGRAGSRNRLGVRCEDPRRPAAGALELELEVLGDTVLRGLARHLRLPGGEILERLAVDVIDGDVGSGDDDGWLRLGLVQNPSGWSVRDARGHRVEPVRLSWRGATARAGGGPMRIADGRAVIALVDDFRPAVAAVRAMARPSTDPALGDGPFLPLAVMQALLTRLGVVRAAWCCESAGLGTAVTAVAAAPPADTGADALRTDPVLAAFRRRCATCHAAASRSPPGFLHGPPDRVLASLRHCAPRIAVRLSMWRRDPAARARSPMPPPLVLAAQGLDEQRWVASEDFRIIDGWARAEAGAAAPTGACLPRADPLTSTGAVRR